MKLIVNCTILKAPLTGIGNYVREILISMIENPEITELEGFYFHDWLSRDQIRQLLKNIESPQEKKSDSIIKPFLKFLINRKVHRWINTWIHAKNLSKRSDWIYWETNYIPLPFLGKTVVTIYDLSHIRYPSVHPKDRVSYLNHYLPSSLNEASEIVTISDFSAQEISDYYGINKKKITIIAPGVSPLFHPRTLNEIDPFRIRYNLPPKYLLSVGTFEPRKNLVNLCLAYQTFNESFRSEFPLVLAGASGWLSVDIEMLIAPLEAKGHIIRLGYVPANDLPILYAGAHTFCYLSLYEGYGMPIAEAIASGISVLTSDRTSMPEVGGNRAWYADPDSSTSIAVTLMSLLNASDPLNPHSSKMFPDPKIHSWDEAAKHLVHLLEICYNADK